MKSSYTISEIKTPPWPIITLSLCEGDGVAEIARVNVPPALREKGIARLLMNQVLADADKEGVTLRLQILPTGSMSFEELEKWYLRLGFEWVGRYMVRPPK